MNNIEKNLEILSQCEEERSNIIEKLKELKKTWKMENVSLIYIFFKRRKLVFPPIVGHCYGEHSRPNSQ